MLKKFHINGNPIMINIGNVIHAVVGGDKTMQDPLFEGMKLVYQGRKEVIAVDESLDYLIKNSGGLFYLFRHSKERFDRETVNKPVAINKNFVFKVIPRYRKEYNFLTDPLDTIDVLPEPYILLEVDEYSKSVYTNDSFELFVENCEIAQDSGVDLGFAQCLLDHVSITQLGLLPKPGFTGTEIEAPGGVTFVYEELLVFIHGQLLQNDAGNANPYSVSDNKVIFENNISTPLDIMIVYLNKLAVPCEI